MPKNYESTYQINLTSNPDEVIAALKQIQKQMENLSANPKIFEGVKKELQNVDKLNADLKQHIAQGIKSPNDFTKINKLITDLELGMKSASDQLDQIKKNSDGAFKFKNIENVNKQIDAAKKSIKEFNDNLSQARKNLSQNLKTVGIDKESAQVLAQEVRTQEELAEKLNEEYNRRLKNLELAKQAAQVAKQSLASSILGQGKTGAFVSDGGISSKGSFSSKKAASEGVNQVVSTTLKEGLGAGQSLDVILASIQQKIRNTGVELVNWDKVVNKVTSVFTDVNSKAEQYNKNVDTARKSTEQIAVLNQETGKLQWSNNSQNLINSFGINNETLNKIEQARTGIINLEQERDKLNQTNTLNNFTGDINNASNAINNFGNEARNSVNETQRLATQQNDLAQSFNRLMFTAKSLLSITSIYRQIRKVISQTFTDVQNLDKAFGSIAMVTNKTVSGLWSSYSEYAKMANELGQTTESAVQASALFYQQGLDTAEALNLTRDTMKLATLAGADFSTATQQMTAALRGFHMEMDQGAHITDVYSELAANAAADVNGIAYAMSKTSSIANSAGMSFETTAAFLTNMIETTQEAPENIGTAMKTIIARFTELKQNVAGTSESEFDDLDYNKVDKALKTVGISIKDATGQFRNLDDVFLELSSKWDSLDRNTQRYIATIAAGSRQQSRFIALMEDYDRTMELVEIAQDSAGRSEEQFSKYSDTLTYKINKLKNSWEQLRISFLNSDTYKSGVDFANRFVEGISRMDLKQFAGIALIGITIGKQLIENLFTGLKQASGQITAMGRTFADKFTQSAKESLARHGKEVAFDYASAIKIKGGITDEVESQEIAALLEKQGITYDKINKKVIENSQEILQQKKLIEESNKELSKQQNIEEKERENYRAALAEKANAEQKLQQVQSKNSEILQQRLDAIEQETEKEKELTEQKEKQQFLEEERQKLIDEFGTAGMLDDVLEQQNELVQQLETELAARQQITKEIKEASGQQMINVHDAEVNLQQRAQDVEDASNALNEAMEATQSQVENIEGLSGSLEGLVDNLRQSAEQSGTLNKLGELGKGALGDAASAGATTVLTMLISGQSLGDALGAALPVAFTAITPYLLKALSTLIEPIIANVATALGALAGPLAIVAVGAVAVGAAWYAHAKAVNAAEKAEEKRTQQLKENIDLLKKEQQQKVTELRDERKRQANLEKSLERYQVLDEKGFRTEKEQAEYESLSDSLVNDFPEIIDSQDENTKHLEINTTALENLKETLQTNIDNANLEVVSTPSKIITEYQAVKDNKESAINAFNSTSTQVDKQSAFMIMNKAFSTEELTSIIPGLSSEDFKDLDNFESKLEKLGYNFDYFGDQLSKFWDNQKEETEKAAKEATKEYYKNLQIDGVEMTDQLADVLSQSINLEMEPPEIYINDFDGHGFHDDDKMFLRAFRDNEISSITGDSNADVLREGLKSRGIEDFSSMFNSGTNMVAYGDLADDFKSFLKRQGVEESEWNNLKNEASKTAKYLSHYFTEIIATQLQDNGTLTVEQIKKYSNQIEDFQNTMSEIGDKTTEELQNIKTSVATKVQQQQKENLEMQLHNLREQYKSLDDYETAEAIELNTKIANLRKELKEYDLLNNLDESIQQAKDAAFELDKTLSEFLNPDDIKHLSTNEKKNLIDNIKNKDLTTETQKQYAKFLTDFQNSYNQEVNDILNSITLEDGYEALWQAKDEYIESLQGVGLGLQEATKVFEDYIQKGTILLGKNIYGKGTAEIFLESLDEEFESFQETYGALIDAQKQLSSNKKLSQKQVKALKKAGYANIVRQYNSGDKKATQSSIEEALISGAMNPLERLRTRQSAIALEQENFRNLDSGNRNWTIKSSYARNAENLEYFFNKYGITNLNERISDEQLIKMLNQDSDKFNDFAKTLNLTTNEIQLLENAARHGAESLAEYEQGMNDYAKELNTSTTETWLSSLAMINESLEFNQEKIEDLKKELEDLDKELEKNQEDIDKAKEGIDKAQESLDKAYESLSSANEEMQEAIHGTEDFKSSLDGLVNYANRLKNLENAISDIKDQLEDVSTAAEASSLFSQLNNTYDRRAATLGAQNRAIDDALDNIKNTLLSNFGSYISFDELGNAIVDFSYMNMDANDEIKKAFEEEYNLWEEYQDKRRDNDKTLRELDKERQEYRKQALDDYVSLQEKVIETLKDQAQEEIDITKEKYDAMAEADSDYLDALQDAINKQKQLREQEKSWNDLATQEKKLSLMQRDTSGANAKEVASLQQSVQDTREKLLDDSVSNIIENLQELYDKQKEARELEIEYMEQVTENAQYFNDWAQSIMSNWGSSEDLISWFMENNPDTKDMTVEQLEQYMSELQDDYSSYSKYAALLQNDMKEDAQAIADEIDFLYNNLSDNVYNIGSVTQEVAQAAADESVASAQAAIDSAYDAIAAAKEEMAQAEETYNDAITKMNDTQTKITETKDALQKAEEDSLSIHATAVSEMTKASKDGMIEVATYAAQTLVEWSGIDYNNPEELIPWAEQHGFMNDGAMSQSLYRALESMDVDVSGYDYNHDKYRIWAQEIGENRSPYALSGEEFETEGAARNRIEELKKGGMYTNFSIRAAYKKGGLADYTGPAWVDGTPSRPEAFLSAEDTALFMNAAELLSQSPVLNTNSYSTVSSNSGDTSVSIYLNVENIADDYSVDQMMERMREDILQTTNPIGSPVILTK